MIGIVILGLNETTVSLLALAAAIGTAVAIYALSYKGGFAGTRLILIGIGVSSMLGAVVTYTLAQASAWDLQVATRWLTGSLNSAGWPRVAPLAATCAVILPSMWVNSSKLATMRFGDDTASGLGVKVFSVRVWTIVAAVTLVAVATSSCGPIAFVGLIVPHLCRLLVGTDHRWMLPFAGLAGACLLLAADTLGRVVTPNSEIDVGIITPFLGAPFFIWIVRRQKVREL